MSTSGVDRRRVMGGVLLAAAGAYILFQPFGVSPAECAGSLGRLTGDFLQAVTMCVAAGAPMFVPGLVVGLMFIVAALWMLVPAESRSASVLFAAAALAIVGAGVAAFVTSPTGPFRTLQPTETAVPAQTSVPRGTP